MKRRLTMFLACLFLSLGMAMAQTKVTGTVVSQEDGQPVIGATVWIEGTSVGTATDAEKDDRVFGTFSANSLAIANGTDFIRVHNVKENALSAKMADAVVRG